MFLFVLYFVSILLLFVGSGLKRIDDEVESEYRACATNVDITVNVFKDHLPSIWSVSRILGHKHFEYKFLIGCFTSDRTTEHKAMHISDSQNWLAEHTEG